ncbi:MAG: hypothetical protein AAFV80_10120, partial [Bacteroidota bacterium]
MLILVADVWGQIEENPFDLDLEPSTEQAVDQVKQVDNDNPFDLDLSGAEESIAPPDEKVVEEPAAIVQDTSVLDEIVPVNPDTNVQVIELLPVLPDNPFDLPTEA